MHGSYAWELPSQGLESLVNGHPSSLFHTAHIVDTMHALEEPCKEALIQLHDTNGAFIARSHSSDVDSRTVVIIVKFPSLPLTRAC